MGNMQFIHAAIDKKLADLHCGYIGKVVWTDGETATVQPLGMVTSYDGTVKAQAVVSNVPVACRYKLGEETITYVADASGTTKSQKVAVPVEIAKGDLVACLCADRDITEARRGKNAVPTAGRHCITDSIIVGIL